MTGSPGLARDRRLGGPSPVAAVGRPVVARPGVGRAGLTRQERAAASTAGAASAHRSSQSPIGSTPEPDERLVAQHGVRRPRRGPHERRRWWSAAPSTTRARPRDHDGAGEVEPAALARRTSRGRSRRARRPAPGRRAARRRRRSRSAGPPGRRRRRPGPARGPAGDGLGEARPVGAVQPGGADDQVAVGVLLAHGLLAARPWCGRRPTPARAGASSAYGVLAEPSNT